MTLIDSDYFNSNMVQLGIKSDFAPKAENLTELIIEASEWVENYLKRKIEVGEVVDIQRGRGSNKLILDQSPVTALTSITYEDDYGFSGTVNTDEVRVLPWGVLEWKRPWSADMQNLGGTNGPWRTFRTYTITYSAGLDPIPSVIKRATALKVVDLFTPQYQGPRDQRSIEFASTGEQMIVDLLEPYRRQRIG